MDSIKYKYAFDLDQRIVSIGDLDPDKPRVRGEYTCVGCGHELIARLGQIRVRHFAHKPDQEAVCATETYLHRLAKALFYQEYTACLATQQPFLLVIPTTTVCGHSKPEKRCIIEIKPVEHDLTRHFPTIHRPETPDGDFIPDVMLTSRKGTDKIYIEMFVTHAVTEKKTSSGVRVVEIKVESEDDLDEIRAHRVAKATLAGFKQEREVDECGGYCKNERAAALWVFTSQKIRPVINTRYEIQREYEEIRDLVVHQQEIPLPVTGEAIVKAVTEAHLSGVKVRNCYLCRYRGVPNAWSRGNTFCKVHQKEGNSNMAVGCEVYRLSERVLSQMEPTPQRNES